MDICEKIETFIRYNTSSNFHPLSLLRQFNDNGDCKVLCILTHTGQWCINWDRVKEYVTSKHPDHVLESAWSKIFWAAKDNFQEISFAQLEKLASEK